MCTRGVQIAGGLALLVTVQGLAARLSQPRESLWYGLSAPLLVLGFDLAIAAGSLEVLRRTAATISARLRDSDPEAPLQPNEPIGYEVTGLPAAIRWACLLFHCIGPWLVPSSSLKWKCGFFLMNALIAWTFWIGSTTRSLRVSASGLQVTTGKRRQAIEFSEVAFVSILDWNREKVAPRLILELDDGRSTYVEGPLEMLAEVAERLRIAGSSAGREAADWPSRAQMLALAERGTSSGLIPCLVPSFAALLVSHLFMNQILIPHATGTITYGVVWFYPALPLLFAGIALGSVFWHSWIARHYQPRDVWTLLGGRGLTWSRGLPWIVAALVLPLLMSVPVTPSYISFNHDEVAVHRPFAFQDQVCSMRELTQVCRVQNHRGRRVTELEFGSGNWITPTADNPYISPSDDLRLCEMAWAATGKSPQGSPCRW